MKYIIQLGIIFIITFVAEIIKELLPLPIPSGIYGMVLLFILLCTGLLKTKHIENVADFLISIMGIMFVPAGVGLISSTDSVVAMLPAIIIAVTVGTVIVMGISGKATDLLLKSKEDK